MTAAELGNLRAVNSPRLQILRIDGEGSGMIDDVIMDST